MHVVVKNLWYHYLFRNKDLVSVSNFKVNNNVLSVRSFPDCNIRFPYSQHFQCSVKNPWICSKFISLVLCGFGSERVLPCTAKVPISGLSQADPRDYAKLRDTRESEFLRNQNNILCKRSLNTKEDFIVHHNKKNHAYEEWRQQKKLHAPIVIQRPLKNESSNRAPSVEMV